MGNGFKVTGLVLGIVGIVSSLTGIAVPILAFVGLPVAIVGLVLSVIGNKKEKSALGTAAFILSLLAVIFTAIAFFTCGLCVLYVAGTTEALSNI